MRTEVKREEGIMKMYVPNLSERALGIIRPMRDAALSSGSWMMVNGWLDGTPEEGGMAYGVKC